MSCQMHQEHTHVHSATCGHLAIQHDGHTDYVHDGHLHSAHDGHYDEHALAVTDANPAVCAPIECTCCESGCGQAGCTCEQVPHGDHLDYICGGRLHHVHGDHCDDHGAVMMA